MGDKEPGRFTPARFLFNGEGGCVKPDVKCGLCILEWVYGRTVSQNNGRDIPQLFRNIAGLLYNKIETSTNLGDLCNEAVDLIYKFVAPTSEFWEEIKTKTNAYVKTLLPGAKRFIAKAGNERERVERALYLAAAGNVAPMGAPSGALAFPEAAELAEGMGCEPILIGDAHDAVRRAKNVLYVTDNAGEIGFDSLLISELKNMGLKVAVVVKDPPYFEDATMEDARWFGVNRTADRIITVKKVFVPGKDEGPASEAYRESDLVIIKGTGNYDALRGETEGKTAIFLLKVKCDPIARDTGVTEGKFVIRLDK
ncbi:MAG: hypothetical protein A4E62_02403 [Syntrophorhabdus sp. PtaU1.Bin002]|nr:MAG: hypothetical protein A4E62_02403 [Syntrophorhabdus sp. PtaU1.Bin002]